MVDCALLGLTCPAGGVATSVFEQIAQAAAQPATGPRPAGTAEAGLSTCGPRRADDPGGGRTLARPAAPIMTSRRQEQRGARRRGGLAIEKGLCERDWTWAVPAERMSMSTS